MILVRKATRKIAVVKENFNEIPQIINDNKHIQRKREQPVFGQIFLDISARRGRPRLRGVVYVVHVVQHFYCRVSLDFSVFVAEKER